ncbi:hypothetical protein [Candidatus Clostridium helianthi]|uniref:DUF3006 domain-containing protein n=1 Tax=Candidatus Clostridium helianthi TaxID=3381660 RepID=A0ABW8S9V1_9CLOT
MSTLIFSTRKIRCKGDDGKEFIIPRNEMKHVPDWVLKTPDYQLGVKGKHITVADTKQKRTRAENGDIK